MLRSRHCPSRRNVPFRGLPVKRWKSRLLVRDRHGTIIELTEERWAHIVEYHSELEEHYDEVVATIRFGRRRQEALDPLKYKYIRPCLTLPFDMTHIVVVVRMARTPFVLSAYGVEKHVKP